MRLVLDVATDPAGRLAGRVVVAGRQLPYSGTFELVAVLQALLAGDVTPGPGPADPVAHDAT